MYQGSCLCGEVKFTITGKISHIVYCHCSQCRKVQGSAYATNGIVHESDFTVIQGETSLTEYKTVTGQSKFFCRHCGSPIMSTNKAKPGDIRVRLGTIESEITERPECHIFVASKANWDEITDELPQYPEYPPIA